MIAPKGFLDAAISENVLAGTVMIRRAMYMYGVLLPKDAQGHVDTGLGKGMPGLPSVALVAPTHEITATGEELTVDGVRLVFQITPGTEAPAEMNIFVPDERALCMAENCTANQHNVYTLRGAQVRDALMWSKYIDQSLELYADQCDVLFASHHWPRWGQDDLSALLGQSTRRLSLRARPDPSTGEPRTHDERDRRRARRCPRASATSSSIGATTERSRTTPRPCTSATSDGSTAIPRTSIPTHRSRRRSATCASWAAPTP